MHCKQTKTGNIWDDNVMNSPGPYEGTLERTCEDENKLLEEKVYMYVQPQKQQGGSKKKKRKRKSSTRRRRKSIRPSKRFRKRSRKN